MGTRSFRVVLLTLAAMQAGVVQAQESPLVLKSEDIPQMRSFAAGLKKATIKGPQQTKAFLAAKPNRSPEMRQRLANVAVAYTAIKLQEQMEELSKLGLDKDPSSEYAQRVAQTRKELDEITAKHRETKAKDGRSALEVNEKIVRGNLASVEQLMAEIRDVKSDSLPQ